MTAEYKLQTNNGHVVQCVAWKAGARIHFKLYVDGQEYNSGDSIAFIGNYSTHDEAKFQATALAMEIEGE